MFLLIIVILHENLTMQIYYICRISLPVYQFQNCTNIHNQTEENLHFRENCHQNSTVPSQRKSLLKRCREVVEVML